MLLHHLLQQLLVLRFIVEILADINFNVYLCQRELKVENRKGLDPDCNAIVPSKRGTIWTLAIGLKKRG